MTASHSHRPRRFAVLRWHWLRWRVAHQVWLARCDYWDRPTPDASARWAWADDLLRRVEAKRP